MTIWKRKVETTDSNQVITESGTLLTQQTSIEYSNKPVPTAVSKKIPIKGGSANLFNIKHIIAIASAKGGVGKSTLTTNLAVALKSQGATVGIMDADIYGPSQPHMLGGTFERPEFSEGGRISPVVKHGVSFISIALLVSSDDPVIWRAPMATKMITQFITQVSWGSLDYLLIDLPPGTGDIQMSLSQQISLSGAIIVTTPQEVALGITKKGIKMFETLNVPILGVVENMSGFTCPHCHTITPIFKEGGGKLLAEKYKFPYLGAIPLDPKIVEAGDTGVPVIHFSPDSPAAQSYLEIASRLGSKLKGLVSDTSQPTEMELSATGELMLFWPDGHRSVYTSLELRSACACAMCIDENNGKKILDTKNISSDIRITNAATAGRYAITAQFSDGHRTGIYTFKRLRELG